MVKKILFPTDYSQRSNAALRNAVSLARQSGALLLIVHVEPASTPIVGGVEPPEGERKQEEAVLAALLTTIASSDKHLLPHEFRTLRGDPASEIVRLAKQEQVELIVMATAGRTGLRLLLMGSVAEAVMREAPCPVLCLREPVPDPQMSGKPLPTESEDHGRDHQDAGIDAGRPNAMALLQRAVSARATDIHIDPSGEDMDVRFRIDGRLERYCRLGREVGRPIVTQLKIMAEMDIADPFHPREGRMTLPDPLGSYEVRITCVPVLGGESIALRVLNRQNLLRPLDSLGLSPESLSVLDQMLQLGEGLVLVTGPAGSGKTTTAYSMIHALDQGDCNIVTIEDPPEYRIARFCQMTVDPRHEVTMTSGLRNILRMDPDVVLVGEIRDAETAEIAMRAASSGKYVFTTLHTRDVASTITAVRDLHIDNRSLAGNLTGIVSQRLVRRLCPKCRQQVPLEAADLEFFASENIDPPTTLFGPVGCGSCHNRGYFERIGVFEVAIPNHLVREAIECGAPEDELRNVLRSVGTRSLIADGLVKLRDGLTSLEEVRSMTWARRLE